MEYNYPGRYVKALQDITIFGLIPGNTFKPINYLKAGDFYPIAVYDFIGTTGNRYMRFKTSLDSTAAYPGANYTYIFFDESKVKAYPQPYEIPETVSNIDKAGNYIKTLVIIGAVAYVAANYLKK